MKIYLDIIHPATLHFFRRFMGIMESNGHEFLVSAKDKDVTLELLNHYKIEYINRGKAASSFIGKVFNIIRADIRLFAKVKSFAPDLIISFGSPVAAHIAFLLRKPCIAIEDTECANLAHKSYIPFSRVALTPSCFGKDFGKKGIAFKGYKELAYLHPSYFKVGSKVHELLGIKPKEQYTIVRFVSRNASHDFGVQGISDDLKVRLVERLSSYSKVFITSEDRIPAQIERYKISIPPWRMHDVIAKASLLIGESATMAAESAMLGVPAIFIDNQGRGYTDELEKYGLVYNFISSPGRINNAINKAIELLKMQERKTIFQQRRNQMLAEKIDVTAFMVWFVENYPKSVEVMKENTEFQSKFK